MVAITLNGEDQGAVTVKDDGSFSTQVTLAEGENSIVIIAMDMAGRDTTAVRTVELKTALPQFHSVSIAPNPADAGQTYIISVEVV